MRDFELYLSRLLSNNKNELELVSRELKECMSGSIVEQKRGDSVSFVHCFYKNGKRIRKGITEQREAIISLIRGMVLKEKQECLLSEQEWIQKCLVNLHSFDLDAAIDSICNRLPDLPEEYIEAMFVNPVDEWRYAEYEMSDYKPEMRKHRTSQGLKVRSKSETLIVEKLYEYNVAFHYEEVLRIGENTLVPDFLIKRADGKIFIWEHMGLMDNAAYRQHQKNKLEMYEKAGFVPWDNLIITYDGCDGIIDLRIVESEIQNKLL